MMGTGLVGRARSDDDRFYVPVRARKNHSQNRQAQRGKGGGAEGQASPASHQNRALASESRKPKEVSKFTSEKPLLTCGSNLERFLEATTPSLPAQYFSKTTVRGWRTCDIEYQHYFTLGDLWESFKEWSAYGTGVPLILDGRDSVVQYYVPYLSGIQLYGESVAKSRHASEDSESDSFRDSSSDGSSDYEIGKGMKSLSEAHCTSREDFSSDDGDFGHSRGQLLFEYLEQAPPYSREPLADKIFDLACTYPKLNMLRSCDLLPVSWISVAWYPIYRIPTGPTLKDLDACFLTYHSLSTPLGGNGNAQAPVIVHCDEMDGVPRVSLNAFGMASYKLKGATWTQNGGCEHQLANSLMQAAVNWLKLLKVSQPDFQFFASHGMHAR